MCQIQLEEGSSGLASRDCSQLNINMLVLLLLFWTVMSFPLLHMCAKYKALHKFCGSLWRYMRGGTGKGKKERVGKRLGSVLLHATQSQLKRFKNFALTVERGSSSSKEYSYITCTFS